MKHTLKTALFASVGIALTLQNVSATNVYNDGDLLLAFRKAGSPDLIFDIGQASTYLLASGTLNLTADGFDPSLLTSVYGSTLTGVKWSVAGFTAADNTTYATDPRVAPANNPNAPFSGAILSSLKQSDTQISTYGNQFRNAAGGIFLSSTATQAPTGNSGSYTSIQGTAGKLKGTFQANIENTIQATGDSQSDLMQLIPNTTPSESGYFDIDSAGNATFVVVPEPSTYALMAIGGLLALVSRRSFRRQSI